MKATTKKLYLLGSAIAGLHAMPVAAQVATDSGELRSGGFQANNAEKTQPQTAPADDPYPIQAAGWGTASGNIFASRWVEDWRALKAAGKAPPLKAIPIIGDDIYLTLNGEFRLRSHSYDNGLAKPGNDYHEFTDRAELGADLHIGEHFRVYGELDHGDTDGVGSPSVNALVGVYKNRISLNQIFGEARDEIGNVLIGAIGGRFEFNDGPKQLISLNNGPNVRLTWNGAQVYMHTDRFRVGLFSGKPTLENFYGFDEIVNPAIKLQAVTVGVAVTKPTANSNLFFDPAYYNLRNDTGRAGASVGFDRRDTYGARLWGKNGRWVFDWMAYRQTGDHLGRSIEAWMASFDQNYALSTTGWKPRVGLRIDLASGGNAYNKTGTIHDFNPIYQGTSYLSEGHLIGYSNLVMISPNVSIAPLKTVRIDAEYDAVRKMDKNDAFYEFGQPPIPYAGTQNIRSRDVGGYGRLVVNWNVTPNINLLVEGDHLSAGKVLTRAKLGSANYGMLSLDFRY